MDKYKLEKLRCVYEAERAAYFSALTTGYYDIDAYRELYKAAEREYFAALDLMSQKEGERE